MIIINKKLSGSRKKKPLKTSTVKLSQETLQTTLKELKDLAKKQQRSSLLNVKATKIIIPPYFPYTKKNILKVMKKG
jgi:hypothetical protein